MSEDISQRTFLVPKSKQIKDCAMSIRLQASGEPKLSRNVKSLGTEANVSVAGG